MADSCDVDGMQFVNSYSMNIKKYYYLNVLKILLNK